MRRILLLAAVMLWLTTPAVVESGTNFLLTSSGSVQLKRYGWSNYIPVAFGTRLQSDDLLKIDGKASVLCANLSAKPVSGSISTPCTDVGILEYHGARFVARKVGPPQNIPYILYPRNTLLLDSRPLLRWRNTGASSYTVAVMQGGSSLWERKVTGRELPYPLDVPALKPNIDYLLLVADNDRGVTSSKDPAKGIGFQVVTEEGLATLRATRDQLMALTTVDAPARQFALGVYYTSVDISESGFRPLGEAWLIFENLAQRHDTPAIHLWRGDVLTRIKLPSEARRAYQAALKSAGRLGDSESEASAHAALWRRTGDEALFNEAIKLYEQLGDAAQADALREEKAQ